MPVNYVTIKPPGRILSIGEKSVKPNGDGGGSK